MIRFFLISLDLANDGLCALSGQPFGVELPLRRWVFIALVLAHDLLTLYIDGESTAGL
jgi:hypothetical protein